MDLRGDGISDLILPESEKRQVFLVYIKLIILPLAVYLIFILGYFGKIDLKVEIHSIVMMGIIFLISLIFARHNAEIGCFMFEQRKDEFRAALKKYIIKHLLPIGKETKSNASFEEFVKVYSADVRNDNYASIAAGVFPVLGILGTFISIAISMPNFSSQNSAMLEHEISTLLTGVGTSFYVSIYGIFLSLWWIFFEKVGMSRFERLINRQKNVTSSFFWTKEEIEQEYLQENLRHFEKIGFIFEQVNTNDFFERLGQAVEKKFKIFNEMIELEQEAVRLNSQHIKETMGILIKSQNEQKDLGKIHGEILNALHSFNNRLNDMQVRFSEQYNRLNELTDDRIVKLDKGLEKLSSDTTIFSESLAKFSNKMLEHQEKVLDGFRVGMIEGLDSFRKILDDETNQHLSTDDPLEELKESLGEIDQETNAIIEKLDKLK